MASAGSAAEPASSSSASRKPAYWMLKPASEGPMKAAIELPSEKVAKFFVRSADVERADEVVHRDVEEDVPEADERAAREQRWRSDRIERGDRERRAPWWCRPTSIGVAHAEAVRDSSRVHREDQRKARRTAPRAGRRRRSPRRGRARRARASPCCRAGRSTCSTDSEHDEVERQRAFSHAGHDSRWRDEYTERMRNASRAQRSMSLRQRQEIQEMLWRRDRRPMPANTQRNAAPARPAATAGWSARSTATR